MAFETLDDFAFQHALDKCHVISEPTAYLEIFSYSDPSLISIEHHPLPLDELDSFLQRKGTFTPATVPDGVSLVAGLRLILQENANHMDTFEPGYISLPLPMYSSMIKALHLPRMAIETQSVVGPFFWSALHLDHDGNTRLHMVFRKSDVRKRGKTRGWELILSHEFSTGITTGFYKGTPTSEMSTSIQQLKACTSEIEHALLLPLIIVSRELSSSADLKQRETRDWLRKIERAVTLSLKISDQGSLDRPDELDLEGISQELVECLGEVLWKRPVAHIAIIDSLKEAAQLFMKQLPGCRETPVIGNFHRGMMARLELYRKRWIGIQTYTDTTMQRIDIQRNVVYNMIAKRESRLNLQIASDQQKLAHISKREAEAMKGISLLGTIFLPGAFIASIFSTTFFDFRDAPDMASAVSPRFWLYWVVTIPCTVVVVGVFLLWESRRVQSYKQEGAKLEEDTESEMQSFMTRMIRWTTARTST